MTHNRRKLYSSKREPKFGRDFERAIATTDLSTISEMTDDSITESYDKDAVFWPHSSFGKIGAMPPKKVGPS